MHSCNRLIQSWMHPWIHICICHFLCTAFGQYLSARFCGYGKSINSFWLQKNTPADFWQKMYTKNRKRLTFSVKYGAFFIFCVQLCHKSVGAFFVSKNCLLFYDTHKNARTDFGQKTKILYTKMKTAQVHISNFQFLVWEVISNWQLHNLTLEKTSTSTIFFIPEFSRQEIIKNCTSHGIISKPWLNNFLRQR